ncbi:MAG: TolC family protein [Armatimonadota bacterium]|nr:TolC family protein [Armatimonadota bacterium]
MCQKLILAALVAAVCAFGGGPALSEETKQTPLSLQQAIEIALKNRLDVITGRNAVEIAGARLTQARSDYYPQLSVQNNTFVIGSAGLLNRRETGTAIQVSQNIFDGGLRETQTQGARHGVTQNRAGLARTAQEAIFDVTRSYYDVLRARHLAEVSEANVKYNEEFKALIQARIDVGSAAAVEILPVQAQLANALVDLLSARNAARTAAVRLQNGMGLSPTPGFDIQDVTQVPSADVQPLETYIKVATASRPDFEEARAGVGVAQASVKSAKISLYPRPVISGVYERGIGGTEGDSKQLTGSIVFDVFNGNRNRAEYREAAVNRANARQRSEQVLKDIRAEVEEAYLNLKNAGERLSASEVSLQSAQANYDAQQARYAQGLAIPLDLLNAEVQVVTARVNAVQARYDYYTAIAEMELATGKHR